MPRGAPLGNQNARKHGFYSKVLLKGEKREIDEAACVDSIDAEIAYLRFKLRKIQEKDPNNVNLQMVAVNMILKALKTRYQLNEEQKSSLKDAMFKVLTEVAVPMGLKFISGAPK